MKSKVTHSMALSGEPPIGINALQKLAVLIGVFGMIILFLAAFNLSFPNKSTWLSLALISITSGIVLYSYGYYNDKSAGIKNDGVWLRSLTSRGLYAWILGICITGFYIILYFFPQYLGLRYQGSNTGLIALFDPLSRLLSGNPASQWFVYGTLYTLSILAFGVKFIWKYWGNSYQVIRTLSVMFFQLCFAFMIPELMARLNGEKGYNLPYYDIKNIWPLNYYNFDQYRIDGFINSGDLGLALLIFGIASIVIITPIFTYFYGKRWYCSWVCGCGGLAETTGDAFRHLSDKRLVAWKWERWMVHSVLVFSILMTTAVVHSYLTYDAEKYWLNKDVFLICVAVVLTIVFALIWRYRKEQLKQDARYGAIGFLSVIVGLVGIHFIFGNSVFIFNPESIRSTYAFLIGSIFSGVIGTGFYPIFGNRVWCRFGCPMAAILGLQQRLFSRFRISTNGGQCISCGNCSTYCEMGIDVRSYAQKGENIIRASCVGCGICSSVCPRGVLKLENGPLKGRIGKTIIAKEDDFDLVDLSKIN